MNKLLNWDAHKKSLLIIGAALLCVLCFIALCAVAAFIFCWVAIVLYYLYNNNVWLFWGLVTLGLIIYIYGLIFSWHTKDKKND